MYLRSLIVFSLCTIFVAGFYVVISYDTSGVGRQSQVLVTSQASCPASVTACEAIEITSASLRTVNYTDELGVVNYATLAIGVEPSGGSAITGLELFIGNSSAGNFQGPFEPGVSKMVSLTVPATISVTPGKTYVVSVEGFYGSGQSAWASTRVTANYAAGR